MIIHFVSRDLIYGYLGYLQDSHKITILVSDLIKITELTGDRRKDFLRYLTVHLAENGINGGILFQPLTVSQSQLGREWESKFLDAFTIPFGEIGWRKVWIATRIALIIL